MNRPKLSIITPSFNQGQYLTQTIRSVLEQNYPNLEYLVLDGGSKDESVSIIQAHESKITYWVSEKDKGQSDAINKGFKIISGDVVNWLNSDDYYEEGSLHHVAEQFQTPSVTCYLGTSHIFGGSKEYFSHGTDIYVNNLAKTIGWARIDQPETFFRKYVIDEIGLLNESLHFVMDKDLWIRYLCKYGLSGIKKDKQLLVHFRHHGESKTISLKEKFEIETISLYYSYAKHLNLIEICQKFESLWLIQELSLNYWPEGLPIEEWKKVFNYFFLYKGFEAYANNEYVLARKVFDNIDITMLSTEDTMELVKVIKRMKYLPVVLKKIVNKFR